VCGFNSDAFDEPFSGAPGYAENPPMQGIVVLGGPFAPADGADNPLPDEVFAGVTDSYGGYSWGYGDGFIDNERLGLTGSISYSNSSNPVSGFPQSALHFYNYMRSIWKNGQPMTHGGTGLTGDVGAQYMYPGVSDPLHLSTAGSEQPEWSELTAGNASGDRMMLASSGPFNLEPNSDNQQLSLAFVFADGDELEDELQTVFESRLTEVKQLWNDELNDCVIDAVIVSVPEQTVQELQVFPNPTADRIRITGLRGNEQMDVRVYNATGALVMSTVLKPGSPELNLSGLSDGLYALVIQGGNSRYTSQVAVFHGR
jgi:hypothetical protein